jgi:hypothetical protein
MAGYLIRVTTDCVEGPKLKSHFLNERWAETVSEVGTRSFGEAMERYFHAMGLGGVEVSDYEIPYIFYWLEPSLVSQPSGIEYKGHAIEIRSPDRETALKVLNLIDLYFNENAAIGVGLAGDPEQG